MVEINEAILKLRTGIRPPGRFYFGLHRPHFQVRNLREHDHYALLGTDPNGSPVDNTINFPTGTVEEKHADPIYEIPNAFPFRGTTYITKSWADAKAGKPSAIFLPAPPQISFQDTLDKWFGSTALSEAKRDELFSSLPEPMQIALAATSTDPGDLSRLARSSCEFVYDSTNNEPTGIQYSKDARNHLKPSIHNWALFETLANNPYLPDHYKQVMVLKPGVQGASEIVGEWLVPSQNSHIFEYLRRNSYIPWGHYAANMADDAIRYRLADLSETDMAGLRHLYYQRSYVRIAEQLGIKLPADRNALSPEQLEELRTQIAEPFSKKTQRPHLAFNATLWGWNFGFDFAPSHYRLHASHQQIHQQFALVPPQVPRGGLSQEGGDSLPADMPTYSCGDLVTDFVVEYRQQTGNSFFGDYLRAIRSNQRMDGNPDLDKSLVVYEDQHIMVFVPKAQTSQWELQLMTLSPVGNILETNAAVRKALDHGILMALKALSAMGARMITNIEYSKRLDSDCSDQHLLYAFLPKLPESPGAFSEAQLRWINGHYPEDFATACREALLSI